MRLVFAAAFLAVPFVASAEDWGSFTGEVVAKWLRPPRAMELLVDFEYVGPDKLKWVAPKGSVIDGASIPQAAWSVIGGPYEGAYREASVIHDVACDEKKRPWQIVHRAFYTGMRALNVDADKAKIMYGAVYHFGPRWGSRKISIREVPTHELDREVARARVEAGPKARVVLSDRGRIESRAAMPPVPTTEVIVGAILEIRDTQQPYSDEGFRRLKEAIEAKDLTLSDIEVFPVHTFD